MSNFISNRHKLTIAAAYTGLHFTELLHGLYAHSSTGVETLKNADIEYHITPEGKFSITITCDPKESISLDNASAFASGAMIPFVEGFQNCTNVKRLKLDRRQTANEDISGRLPKNLEHLDASWAEQLDELPEPLPESLLSLDISHTNVCRLPETLPPGLITISANGAGLTRLPKKFPDTLKELYCNQNRLTEFPTNLPDSLTDLCLDKNKLRGHIQTLPAGLINLSCADTHIYLLPDELPSTLKKLNCDNCLLLRLPKTLPAGLEWLNIKNNKALKELPDLPSGLQYINIDFNSKLLNAVYKNISCYASDMNEPKSIIERVNVYNKMYLNKSLKRPLS